MAAAGSGAWVETVVTRLDGDPLFERYAGTVESTIRFDLGEHAFAIAVSEGAVEAVHEDPTLVAWDYAVRGSEATWSKLLAATPPPCYQDLIAAWFQEDLVVEGDLERTVQDIRALKRIVEVFREVER